MATGEDVLTPSTGQDEHTTTNEYRFSLTISVRDPHILWRAAAAQALAVTGLDQEDIEDVIGPMDDPQIADCLSILLTPATLSGCMLRDQEIVLAPRSMRKGGRTSAHSLSGFDICLDGDRNTSTQRNN